MNEQEQLLRFQNVVNQLIDPEKGCPWDREQTPLSMCEYLIEECHELVDAVPASPAMPATKWATCFSSFCSWRAALNSPDSSPWATL